MKKIIMGIMMVLVLVSLASAGLVSFLSNTVSGTISVEGPVFYLDESNILGEKLGSGYLKLNNNSVEGDWFKLDSNKFYSDSLGVESFYPMNFTISLDMNVSNLLKNATTGDLLESCSVQAVVYKVGETGGSANSLTSMCNVIQIGIFEGNYKDYEISCEGKNSNSISFKETDRFELFLDEQCSSGTMIDIKYGTSYIQVVAK